MFNRLAELREKREQGEGGFTLIELLVVVVIIGILIAIAIPLYLNYRRGANDKGTQSDMKSAVTTIEQCNSDNSAYPTAMAANGTLSGNNCANQVKLSNGSTITYFPNNATTPTAYLIMGTNSSGNVSGGTNGYYCYDSGQGGQVKKYTGTEPTQYSDGCK